MSLQAVFLSGSEVDQASVGLVIPTGQVLSCVDSTSLQVAGKSVANVIEAGHRIFIQANSTVLANEEFWGPAIGSYQVTGIAVVPTVAGSTSTTFQLGKCTGSNALASAIPLTTAVVVVSGADWSASGGLIASAALCTLQPGDRLCAIKTGVWQPPTAVSVNLQLTRLA